MDRRLITPAEAVLLLAPAPSTATRCIQAGLLSLVSAKRITFEPASSMFRRSALLINPPATSTTGPLPAHLIALEHALDVHGERKRLTSTEVVQALQRRFGLAYGLYLRDEVAPGLIKRDLLVRTNAKWLGLFPYVRYARTPGGDTLVAPLQRLMLDLERLPTILAADPDQAIRLARSAGVLLVMSSKAKRQIPKLRKLLAKRGDDLGILPFLPLEDRDAEWELMLDLGDMALAFDIAALFDGIDTVSDFTGGDSSASDGGDGGGGGD